jgi:hypothetical protein
MRNLVVLVVIGLLGPLCSAEVLRCTDTKGNVSYTDSGCPAGARQVGSVPILAPPDPDPYAEANRARALQDQAMVRSRDPAAMPPHLVQPMAQPGGAVVMNAPLGDTDVDPYVDYGYGYGYPGRPLPPRDMRPRIRNCDAGGCQDWQGNRYDRTGQLSSYRSLTGQNCKVVGTTQVCR